MVGLSAATEAGIAASQGGSAAAAAAALLGVLPMGADPTSEVFADALRAAGAAYVGAITEHAVQRGMFAGAQGLAGAVFETTESIRATTAAISTAL
ncbi:PE family protein [Mycolicibacterium confluentis]|nr:PE family protein [Mycolicibacterium confluentis]